MVESSVALEIGGARISTLSSANGIPETFGAGLISQTAATMMPIIKVQSATATLRVCLNFQQASCFNIIRIIASWMKAFETSVFSS